VGRQQLEQALLEEMQTAEQAYHSASAEYKKAMQWHGNVPDHPYGAHVVREAAALERAALERYVEALKAFSDLVIQGRQPSHTP